MSTEVPHVGIMEWTRGDAPRPMAGSAAAQTAHEEWLAKREQDLKTPEGQKWLEKHGAI